MDDTAIIELYWSRDQRAITASDEKYGPYCRAVANNILASWEDTEECVSDTWFRAWNAIPPERPRMLSAFFAKITRNLALNRFRAERAEKRGGGQTRAALDELEECVGSPSDVETEFSNRELERDVNRFLRTLSRRDRSIFMERYFFVEPVAGIAGRWGIKESNALLILSRTRKKLGDFLRKEGYIL